MELHDEQIQFNKNITRRRSKLDMLMASEQGRAAIDSMIHFVASRASVRSAAARIGVNPNTLSKWIMRGKQEDEGVYRELYDRIVVALGHAVAEAEVEQNNMKPEFYLRHGPARMLLGDVYNVQVPEGEYNLDGSVSLTTSGQSPTGITEATTQDEITNGCTDRITNSCNDDGLTNERTQQQDNTMTLEALAALRESGVDVNLLIDDLIAQNKPKEIIEKKYTTDD